MKRRRFINIIGAAIVGTAIALKLPETIAPLNHWFDRPQITFRAMTEAYEKAKEQTGDSPSLLFLNPATWEAMRQQVEGDALPFAGPHYAYHGIWFQDAMVVNDKKLADNQINVYTTHGRTEEFYFI